MSKVSPRTLEEVRELQVGDSIPLNLSRYYDRLNREEIAETGRIFKKMDSGNYIEKGQCKGDQYDPWTDCFHLTNTDRQLICSEGDRYVDPVISFSTFGKRASMMKIIDNRKREKLKDDSIVTFYVPSHKDYISMFVYELLDLVR